MYNTVEEVDEALKKLRKRKEKANELTSSGTWGGLLRGSTSKAGILEQERNLIKRKEELQKRGHTIDVAFHISEAKRDLLLVSQHFRDKDPLISEDIDSVIKDIERIKRKIKD